MAEPKPPTVSHAWLELEALYVDLLRPDLAPVPVSTGFDRLDLLLGGGTAPGDLVYLAAHASVGKTAFALQMAVTWAESGRGVLVVSQEMTLRAVARRLVAQQQIASPTALKRHVVEAESARQLARLVKRWQTLPLFLTETARSIGAIAYLLATWPAEYQPRPTLLIVDYLQLTDAPPDVKGYEKAEYVSRTLKAIAVQAKATALVLSATVPPANASVEDDVSMFSLRGSRGLSFDADVILLLKRKKGAETAILEIEKARDGQTGRVDLWFRHDCLRFEEAIA